MPSVHLKDMAVVEGEPVMAEIGEGNLDWVDLLQACTEAGTDLLIVEQDVCRRDPFESLAISRRNLAQLGATSSAGWGGPARDRPASRWVTRSSGPR